LPRHLAISLLVVGCHHAYPTAQREWLTVLSTGSEPRRPLRFPRTDVAADLTVARREESDRNYGGRHEHQSDVERTVTGSFEITTGRGRLDFGPPVPPRECIVVVGSTTSCESPHHFEFALDPRRFVPQRLAVRSSYADAMFAALPHVFPDEPLGSGAHWQIVSKDGVLITTTTWDVVSIDDHTVVLSGQQVDNWIDDWSFQKRPHITMAMTTIDVAPFSISAKVYELSASPASWSQSFASTVTIRARAREGR
jgi:hypothetical protein